MNEKKNNCKFVKKIVLKKHKTKLFHTDNSHIGFRNPNRPLHTI